jgi:hypothetical protein
MHLVWLAGAACNLDSLSTVEPIKDLSGIVGYLVTFAGRAPVNVSDPEEVAAMTELLKINCRSLTGKK